MSVACQKRDALSATSVLSAQEQGDRELNQWIETHYVKPYNVEVAYRWASEGTFDQVLLYPPSSANVQEVLQAMRQIGFELFEQEMGTEFYNMLPLTIQLYGGVNDTNEDNKEKVASEVIEQMFISGNSPLKMTIFRVDEFQKDETSVRRLMRNFFNNYAKLFIWKKPYDRETFEALNRFPYRKDIQKGGNIYEINSNVYNGFFSLSAARHNVDEDFTETVSMMLSFSPTQIDAMIEQAATPLSEDPKDVEDAQKARQILEAKRKFVTDYFKKEYHLDLNRLSYLCVEKRQAYLKQE